MATCDRDGSCQVVARDEDLGPFPYALFGSQEWQEYFALITHMDVQIGRVLDALEARA